MNAAELIALRRTVISDGSVRRQVPTATVFAQAPLAPLTDLLAEINRPGRLPTGLRAEPQHLVIRAAAQALVEHPWFGNLLLPGGAAYEGERMIVRVTLDGPGSTADFVIDDPAGRPIEQVVAELDASAVETRIRQQDDARKRLRQRRTRPLVHWFWNDAVSESIVFVRDRVRLPQSWIRVAVDQIGNLCVHDASGFDAAVLTSTLTGARLAQVIAPRARSGCTGPDGRAEPVLRLGLGYDMRLFEPHEAAAYLRSIVACLSNPNAESI